jgi:hypothetical protein
MQRVATEKYRQHSTATSRNQKDPIYETLKPQPHRKILHNSDGSSCIIGSTTTETFDEINIDGTS